MSCFIKKKKKQMNESYSETKISSMGSLFQAWGICDLEYVATIVFRLYEAET